jgi:hypothetical protein
VGWYGVVFDTQDEAKDVMEFLEKGIGNGSKVDSKQTEVETVSEKGKKDVGKD